jgi:hypothetical protein
MRIIIFRLMTENDININNWFNRDGIKDKRNRD